MLQQGSSFVTKLFRVNSGIEVYVIQAMPSQVPVGIYSGTIRRRDKI